MKRYEDKDIKNIKFTKYKIVVPTQEDREELMEGFRHIHYSDIDTENIVVNQLAHEYLSEADGGNNIIVDKEFFEKLQ